MSKKLQTLLQRLYKKQIQISSGDFYSLPHRVFTLRSDPLYVNSDFSFVFHRTTVSLSNSKWEQTQAFQWIRHNLEECDNNINLPKHEVYDDYK